MFKLFYKNYYITRRPVFRPDVPLTLERDIVSCGDSCRYGDVYCFCITFTACAAALPAGIADNFPFAVTCGAGLYCYERSEKAA